VFGSISYANGWAKVSNVPVEWCVNITFDGSMHKRLLYLIGEKT